MSIPNQPRIFAFSKRIFGKKKPEQRSFKSSWFDSFAGLHYDEECILVLRRMHGSFISDGFSN
ncbi:hypothetical protein DPMN_035554 [Dreissena polymorpha]|uniref:Uncharacterized protein n=1 Tax=Dreissena polymorpha TaxID=45954 RepID=A0A9D4RL43_DREPO|nr:hypothetical protein DPMN_035554 [Dreissena polymorpha]